MHPPHAALGFRSHWKRCGRSPLGDGEVGCVSRPELMDTNWAAGADPLGADEPGLWAGHRVSWGTTLNTGPGVCCVCTHRAAAIRYRAQPELQDDQGTTHFGCASETGNHGMSPHICTSVGPWDKSKKKQNSAHQNQEEQLPSSCSVPPEHPLLT